MRDALRVAESHYQSGYALDRLAGMSQSHHAYRAANVTSEEAEDGIKRSD
jgi:hypothetical protein